MKCCDDPHVVQTQYHSMVCMHCGIERKVLVNSPDYSTYMSTGPLTRLYSRPERWTTLVKKVCGLHSGPPTTDPVWEYLKKRSPFKNPKDIIKHLRKSKLRNKHYPSLHAFCKVFDKSYVVLYDPRKVLKELCSYFDHVMLMWNRSPINKFFSYAWLIEQGLEIHNRIPYLLYVKKLMCPTRRNKYAKLLLTLYGTHVGRSHHELQVAHLRCAKKSSSNPHNQSPRISKNPSPEKFVMVGGVRLPHDLVYKYLKPRGDSEKT